MIALLKLLNRHEQAQSGPAMLPVIMAKGMRLHQIYQLKLKTKVELPSGYGTAWANNLGEYVVTESPGYNPNVDSNQHWEQLTPVR